MASTPVEAQAGDTPESGLAVRKGRSKCSEDDEPETKAKKQKSAELARKHKHHVAATEEMHAEYQCTCQ
ncbi:hypothetical protein ABBQ32_001889 [Trebouxia sp. C0010 RCD-2024]